MLEFTSSLPTRVWGAAAPGSTNQVYETASLPVYSLNPAKGPTGIYDLNVPRQWVVTAAPWLKAITVVLRGLLPIGSSIIDATVPDAQAWQHNVATQLQHLERSLEAVGELTDYVDTNADMSAQDSLVRVDTGLSRTIRAYLRGIDPGFAGLLKVRTPQGYRWIHARFVDRYGSSLPEIPATRGTLPNQEL